jgi:CelD/BcsL family acetyltransferase involved in cellulose biosynthesis
MLKIEVIDTTQGFAGLEEPWTRLMQGAAQGSIFQTFAWNYTWWRHLGAPRYHLHLLTATQAGEIVGIMPLVYRKNPWRGRRFELMAKKVSNYLDLIVVEDKAEPIVGGLLRGLWRQMSRRDVLVLEHVPEASARRLRAAASADGIRLTWRAGETAWIVRMDSSWSQYLAQVPRRFRYDVQRQIRRLTEQGHLEFRACLGEEELEPALNRLFALKIAQRRKAGERASYFEDQNFQSFDLELVRRLWAAGWLYLHELRLNGRVIAVNFDLQYGGRAYCHEIAYDVNFDAKFSPGKIVQYLELEKAFELRFREFDFGLGDSFYKNQWCNDQRNTVQLIMTPNALLLSLLGEYWPNLLNFYRNRVPVRLRQRIKKILRKPS